MDNPSVADAADLGRISESRSADQVEKLETAYYEYLPKWSNPPTDMNDKYTEVITFHIRYGKGDDFRSAVARSARGAAEDEFAGALFVVPLGERRARRHIRPHV